MYGEPAPEHGTFALYGTPGVTRNMPYYDIEMLGICKKDDKGRQIRVEHRGRHLRASRTGGVSLRAQAEAAGLNFTVNSSHGTRVSRRVAKGTNIAFQKGDFRLRGRYGSGATKVNLSKSGVSLSTRNRIGTINLTNPNRSSAKIAGVQMRGKKAAQIQTAYLLIIGIAGVIRFAFVLIVNTLIFALYAAEWLGRSMLSVGRSVFDGARALVVAAGDRRARRRHQRLIKQVSVDDVTGGDDPDEAEAVIVLMLTVQARGRSTPGEDERSAVRGAYAESEALRAEAARPRHPERITAAIERTVGEAKQSSKDRLRREDAAFIHAVHTVADARDSRYLLSLLYLLDDLCMRLGERTRRQEELLDIYCEQAGITVEAQTQTD